jgi:predicted HD superfamily hydrolase involved in NAD metabolism
MDAGQICACYQPTLEQMLTPRRLRHSLGVMQVMGDLAEVYQIEPELALTAGLLHDAAKDLSLEARLQLMQETGYKAAFPEEWDYNLYLHGPLGALLVRKQFGLDDQQLLDAIHMHTFCGDGEQFHSSLVWCLRFSDLLEPNRKWSNVRWLREGSPRLRRLAFAGRLEEAALLHSGWLVQWFESAGYPLHPNIRRSYDYFSARLGLDAQYMELQ